MAVTFTRRWSDDPQFGISADGRSARAAWHVSGATGEIQVNTERRTQSIVGINSVYADRSGATDALLKSQIDNLTGHLGIHQNLMIGDDLAGRRPGLFQQGQRHMCGLARTRRRDKHGVRPHP